MLIDSALRRYQRPVRACGIALVLVVLAGCAGRVNIVGDAMAPTLKSGEKVLMTRAFNEVGRGDIVGFRYPRDVSKDFIQRVIGVPGDRIESVQGRILIDGQDFPEPYVVEANRSQDSWGPVTVPDGQYFVMGDNRRNSSDSRSWGMVGRDLIWAKVVER